MDKHKADPAAAHPPAAKKPRAVAIWAALFTLYLVWGSTYLAIRYAVESLPPFLMSSARALIAGGLLYVWRRARGDAAPSRVEWRSTVIIGISLLVGGSGGVAWSERRVTSSVASLLVGTLPLWMVLLDALRPGGQRPGWWAIVGVVTGFIGVVVLLNPTQSIGSVENVDPLGAAIVIAAAFFWSLGSIYSRTASLPSSPLLATAMQMISGGVALLLLGALFEQWGQLNLAAISARSLWASVYLLVFGSLIGFTTYTWLLRVAPTPLVSTCAYVNPLVALLLGYFVGGESLAARTLVAAAIIVGSVALITATSENHEWTNERMEAK